MLPQSRQTDLAEFFLSGLIELRTPDVSGKNPDENQYDFIEGTRECFLNSIRISESINVLENVFNKIYAKLSEYIDREAGGPIDFKSLLADPSKIDCIIDKEKNQPFASVATKVLERLGGNYAELANRIKHHKGSSVEEIGEIEFVNRMKEKDYITDKYCPQYLLILAPMGYGKTRLLLWVEQELEKQGWLAIHIFLPREKTVTIKDIYCIILKINKTDRSEHELIIDILKYVLDNKNKKLILSIDNTESINNDMFKKICKSFFEILREELYINGIQFRLILTRRYISDWEIDSESIPFREYYLSGFDYPVVLDTVNLYAKSNSNKKTTDDYRKIFASYLMYYTAGYPKAMVEILKEDFGRSKTLLEETENGIKYYKKNLVYVINDILEHIFPVDLRSVFLELSPVRKFNTRFIEFCIKENLIETDKNQFELEDLLLRTHLMYRRNGFLQDHITRRLLAIHLYQTRPDNFINICEKSITFYEERLKDPKIYSPHTIMIEFIFQKVQYQFYKRKIDTESVFKFIDEMLCNTISFHDSIPFIENTIESLEKDNEFRFMFNYMMKQEDYYDQQPFYDLIQKIKKIKNRIIRKR